MKHAGVIPALAALTLLVAGCSGTTDSGAASAAASPSISEGTPAPSASWSPKDGLHVKVVAQLTEAQPVEYCSKPAAAGTVGVGTKVALADSSGTPVATVPLHAVQPGDTFGANGYTFSGWDDTPLENGQRVTHACFYLADFPDTPSSEGFFVTINDVSQTFDTPTVQSNGGWLPVLM